MAIKQQQYNLSKEAGPLEKKKHLKIYPRTYLGIHQERDLLGKTQDRIRDEQLVQEAWQLAKKYIQNESYKLIILDEINIATKLGYLAPEEIINFLKSLNNRKNHIVLTGRGASDSIINYADLVTEMKLVRHPFKEQGIKAQKCVEF